MRTPMSRMAVEARTPFREAGVDAKLLARMCFPSLEQTATPSARSTVWNVVAKETWHSVERAIQITTQMPSVAGLASPGYTASAEVSSHVNRFRDSTVTYAAATSSPMTRSAASAREQRL
jgi:hypothetical protein